MRQPPLLVVMYRGMPRSGGLARGSGTPDFGMMVGSGVLDESSENILSVTYQMSAHH